MLWLGVSQIYIPFFAENGRLLRIEPRLYVYSGVHTFSCLHGEGCVACLIATFLPSLSTTTKNAAGFTTRRTPEPRTASYRTPERVDVFSFSRINPYSEEHYA